MITQSITCDGCGTVKKETNHWFKLVTDGESLVIFPASKPRRALTKDCRATHNTQDLCGSACVIKKVSEFLSKGETNEI